MSGSANVDSRRGGERASAGGARVPSLPQTRQQPRPRQSQPPVHRRALLCQRTCRPARQRRLRWAAARRVLAARLGLRGLFGHRLPCHGCGRLGRWLYQRVFRLMEHLDVPRRGLSGPWGHKYPHLGVPGPTIGLLEEVVRWFDHWLKGQDSPRRSNPAEDTGSRSRSTGSCRSSPSGTGCACPSRPRTGRWSGPHPPPPQ